MPTFVVTGSYSAKAAADMLDNPRDRESLARGIVEAVGGSLDAWYVTTGPTDILMMVTVDSVEDLMAGLIVGAGSGNFSGLETQRAFTSAEFTKMQEKAASIRASYT